MKKFGWSKFMKEEHVEVDFTSICKNYIGCWSYKTEVDKGGVWEIPAEVILLRVKYVQQGINTV